MPDFPYNITGIMKNNMTDFGSFVSAVSMEGLRGYWIGLFIMLMVFSVFTLALMSKGYRGSGAVCVGMWATALVTLLLRPMGLIPDFYWWLGLSLIPVSVLIMFVFREEAY
jgi:hypothetical protein